MKNYILNLTFKTIKNQKKKYFLLFIGVILSVTLINSILLITQNMNEYEIERSKKSNGDYYFAFLKTEMKYKQELKKDSKVDPKSISRIYFETENNFNQFGNNLRVDIVHADKEAFENMLFLINIKKGSLPKNSNEVIIEEWTSRRMGQNVNIGDKIDTIIDGQKVSYKVVGYYQNFMSSQYKGKVNIYTLLDDKEQRSFKKDSELNIYFKLKPNIPIKENINTYETMIGKKHFEKNDHMFMLLGTNGLSEMDIMSIILIIPVIFVSIIMIFNNFNISILEKMRYFGLLRIIGASKRKILVLVIFEAVVIALIALPIGILISILIVKYFVPLLKLNMLLGEHLHIFQKSILASSCTIMFTMVVSAYFPAKFASKVSPIDAALNRGNIKKDSIKKKKLKCKKEKNIIIEMANINIKRNKKRYIVTLTSIAVSCFLIVAYTCFLNIVSYVLDKQSTEDYKITSKIYKKETMKEKDFLSLYNPLVDMKEINTIFKTYKSLEVNTYLSKGHPLESVYDITKAYIDVYEDTRLKSIPIEKYILYGQVDLKKMTNENEVLVIRKKSSKANNLKVGDTINLKIIGGEDLKVKIGAVLDRYPFYMENILDETNEKKDFKHTVTLIASETLANKISKNSLELIGYDISVKKNSNMASFKEKVYDIISKVPQVKWIELEDMQSRANEGIRQINVFMLLFLAITSSVAFLNLFNTIQANIIIRRREICMLKAIGVPSKDIDKMIYLEGFIFCIKGAIIGILSAIIPIQIETYLKLKWFLPLWIVVAPILFTLIMGYLSTKIPLNKMHKVNIIEGIKMED